MGRQKLHDSLSDRVKACRESKTRNSTNKAFCSVCNDFIVCNGDVDRALLRHRASSKRHKEIVNSRKSNSLQPEISMDESLDEYVNEIELGNDDLELSGFRNSPYLDQTNPEDVKLQTDEIVFEDSVGEIDVESTDSSDTEVHNMTFEEIPEEIEYLLMNTSLAYGRKTVFSLLESPILNVQEILLKGFNNIVKGKSPYEFSLIKGREIDWVTALELTNDFIDSNESILLGNRRVNTTRKALKRETKKSAMLPKTIETLLTAFCKHLRDSPSIHQWTGGFFNEFLTEANKQALRSKGIRWRPMTGHFIPVESAIAQMLLRLKVDDFDCKIGPCYKNNAQPSGQGENIRVYNSFNSSKYAIDLQRKINSLCTQDICKPLLLGMAVWVDKSPLNKNMTRKATPVMMYLMNDKTRTPFRIGYAPDDFVNNDEFLDAILRNQNVSQAASVNLELIREHKRQALIDFLTRMVDEFLKEVVANRGMDAQVGIGPTARYFRLYPVLTHFITDNVQAVELCSINIDHCRMGTLAQGKDFAHYQIGDITCCSPRDFAVHEEVCAKYSKYETIRIKNIAEGHNATSLEPSIRKNIKDSKERKEKLGGLSCTNHLYGFSRVFQDVPGNFNG